MHKIMRTKNTKIRSARASGFSEEELAQILSYDSAEINSSGNIAWLEECCVDLYSNPFIIIERSLKFYIPVDDIATVITCDNFKKYKDDINCGVNTFKTAIDCILYICQDKVLASSVANVIKLNNLDKDVENIDPIQSLEDCSRLDLINRLNIIRGE